MNILDVYGNNIKLVYRECKCKKLKKKELWVMCNKFDTIK